MKDMNIPVEVENALKQLKSGVEVENNTIGKSDRTSDGSGSLKSKRLIWRFVYNTCGYHHTPIPSQLSPKLEFAHPSPLSPNISTKIMSPTIDNLLLMIRKLTRLMKYMYNSVLCRLSIQTVHICNNHDNECNLQSINNDNGLYNNRLNNYTLNELILMNITKI